MKLQKFYSQFKDVESAFIELHIEDPIEVYKKKNKDHCGWGTANPKIMFVSFTPSDYVKQNKKPFSDKPHQKISGVIQYIQKKANIKNNFYLTYAVTKENDTPERFFEEVDIINPKIIIFFGKKIKEYLDQKGDTLCTGNKFYSAFWLPSFEEMFFDRKTHLKEFTQRLNEAIERLIDASKEQDN